jgi:AcrR family transcriptional regulator
MADVMTEQGYVATSVAHVIRRAGVSRETFYEQFASKQDCFSSAFELAESFLFGQVEASIPGGTPMATFEAALGVYLHAVADHPALARIFLIEVYAAGPVAIERRAMTQRRFVSAIATLLRAHTQSDHFACEALVAAIGSMVTVRLGANDVEGIRELHAPLCELVVRMMDGLSEPLRTEV